MGREVALGGAAALAVFVGHLVQKCTILLGAVVVGVECHAVLRGGVQKHLAQRAVKARVGDIERATLAMEAVLKLLVVFRAFEQRQHIVITPARIAQTCPVVVVPAVTAHIKHRVDGAGAAQRLAARLVATPAVQTGLWHGFITVVVDFGGHHGHHAGRRVDQYAAVWATGLQQADRHVRVFAQARRQYTTGRARAHDHVVKFHLRHLCLQFLCWRIVKSGW